MFPDDQAAVLSGCCPDMARINDKIMGMADTAIAARDRQPEVA